MKKSLLAAVLGALALPALTGSAAVVIVVLLARSVLA